MTNTTTIKVNNEIANLIIRGTTKAAAANLKARGLTLHQINAARFATALRQEVKAFVVETTSRRDTLRHADLAAKKAWLYVGCTSAAAKALANVLEPKTETRPARRAGSYRLRPQDLSCQLSMEFVS